MRFGGRTGRSVPGTMPPLLKGLVNLGLVSLLILVPIALILINPQRSFDARIALIGSLGIASLMLLFWRAEHGIFLVILTMPLMMKQFILPMAGVNIKVSDWLAMLAIGIFMLRLPVDRTLWFHRDPLRWPVILYIITGVVSTLLMYDRLALTGPVEKAEGMNSLYLRTWTQAIWGVYSLLLYTTVVSVIRTKGLLRAAITTLFIVSAAVALYAISGHRYWLGGGFRILGTFSEPSYYAEWLILVLPTAIAVALSGEVKRWRVLQIGLVFLLFMNLVLTFSTGGYISGGLAILLTLVLAARTGLFQAVGRMRLVLGTVGVLFGVTLVVMMAVPDAGNSLQRLVSKITNPEESTHSAMVRERARYAARLMFMDYPWIGVGPGNFPFYRLDYVQDDPSATNEELEGRWDTNNLFLEVLAERGVLGALVFFLIWAAFFASLARTMKTATDNYTRAVAVGMTASAVGLLIGYWAHANFFRIYVWVFMGLAMAAVRVAPDPNPAEEMATTDLDGRLAHRPLGKPLPLHRPERFNPPA